MQASHGCWSKNIHTKEVLFVVVVFCSGFEYTTTTVTEVVCSGSEVSAPLFLGTIMSKKNEHGRKLDSTDPLDIWTLTEPGLVPFLLRLS